MSVEKTKEFMAALKEKGPDEALNEKATAAKTEEEKIAFAVDIAHEMGYDVTAADIKEAMKQEDMMPLDDEDLDAVAGGAGSEWVLAKCPICGNVVHAELTGRNDGAFILWKKYEYRCLSCGSYFWN